MYKRDFVKKTMQKMERKVSRGLKYTGNKKQANNGQRTSGMEEDFIGKEVLEGTIAGVEKKRLLLHQ
jgi:hypothetical protein